MSVRAKSRRRIVALVTGVCLLIGGASVWYVRRERQRDAEAIAARIEGIEAYTRGDYQRAAASLRMFLKRPGLPVDALALLRYAESVLALGPFEPKHLQAALPSLRRCVALDPENDEARWLLLDLYLRTGLRTEAYDQAAWFLARDPGNTRALLAQAQALAGMKRYDEALTALAYVHPDTPLLEDQILYLDLMARLGRSRADLSARVEQVMKALGGADPRFSLLRAHARLLAGDVADGRALLLPLLTAGKADEKFARLLLRDLEAAGLPNEGLEVLKGLDPSRLEPGLQSLLVRRLWEAGEIEAIPERVSALAAGSGSLPTPVLGYEALALARLQRPDEARAVLKTLEVRTEDAAARGWVRLLRGVALSGDVGVRARIDVCLAAIREDDANPVAHLDLGLAYRDAAELELAARELGEALRLSPTWAEPAAKATAVFLQLGQLDEALRLADVASDPESLEPGVQALLALARTARDDRAKGPLRERLLGGLAEAGLSPDVARPVEAELLADLGRLEEARAKVEDLLAMKTPSGSALLKCAQVSRAHALGLEERCLSAYEAAFGSTPELALARARAEADVGGVAAGLRVFRQRRAEAERPKATEWALAEVAFLEANGLHDEAIGVWREIAAHDRLAPAELREILRSASAWQDRPFVRDVIGRLEDATGETGLWWRIYRAKWAVTAEAPAPADVSRSVEQLKSVLVAAPSLTWARVLLSRAYELAGQPQNALEALQAARPAGGAPAALDLNIARLELQVGESGAARTTLGRLANARSPAFDWGTQAAVLYVRLGEKREVLALLGKLDLKDRAPAEKRQLARLYAASGELDRASELMREGLVAEAGPRDLLFAATLEHARGHEEEALGLLARMRSSASDAVEATRLMAEYHRRFGELEAAESDLQTVVADPAARPTDWLDLLSVEVLAGRIDGLPETLASAARAGAFLREGESPVPSEEVLRGAAEQAWLRRLAVSYVSDPEADRRDAAGRALKLALALDRESAPPDAGTRLRTVARSAPMLLPLQVVVGAALSRIGDLEEAVQVLKAAGNEFPAEAEPARALALAYRARSERSEAEGRSAEAGLFRSAAADAAREWRERETGSHFDADWFLAAQAEPAAAASLLEPYVPDAVEKLRVPLLRLYAEALIRSGKAAQAEALLGPHLAESAALRRAWASLAAVAATSGHADVAARWLGNEALRGRGDPDLDLDVSTAWVALSQLRDQPEPGAKEKAEASLREAASAAHLDARQSERLGLLYAALGRPEEAEASYRAAVAADPPPPLALNNLAMVLLRKGRPDEALPLAQTLVRDHPRVPEFQDTLAEVSKARQAWSDAVAAYERCREIQPDNPRWALAIVETLKESGQIEAARTRLDALAARYPRSSLSDDSRRAWSELERELGE